MWYFIKSGTENQNTGLWWQFYVMTQKSLFTFTNTVYLKNLKLLSGFAQQNSWMAALLV